MEQLKYVLSWFLNINEATNDLARVFRAESGRVLAVLIGYCKDIDLAEDALQDACLQAIEQWRKQGLPENKGAWLLAVARRRLIDRLRRSVHQNKQQTLQSIIDTQPDTTVDEINQPIPDERLKLIFTCCHPALSQQAQIALTLKSLCGLSIREIARAFLTSEVTMNQRISRAKQKIKKAGIPYQIPNEDCLPERLSAVLSVIYLIFNESYSAYEGQSITRNDLANEAIRLTRILLNLSPRSDVSGLLALLLFHHSRRDARSTEEQPFIPLEKQNRRHWDQALIKEASDLLKEAMKNGKPDVYQIQAAISALHSEAENWQSTDWPQILLLYQSLYRLNSSPIVALNLNVALAHSGQYKKALQGIIALESELIHYQPYYAARAYINRKSGKIKHARKDYQRAIALSKNTAERDFLIKQHASALSLYP